MLQLKVPGLYEIEDADYFSDPCPQPSLTQSIAKILLDRSPMHAAYAHPRLNPQHQPDDDKKYDTGNVCHAMLMGRGREFHLIDADDWRTKAAREERETAIGKGKIPCLRKTMTRGLAMHHAALETLRNCDIEWREGSGIHSEVAMVWEEKASQANALPTKAKKRSKARTIWLRTKMDRCVFDKNTITVFDYKTTAMSAADSDVSRRIYDQGWDVQAAMHARGLAALHPLMAGCTRHVFLVQETEPPYAMNVFEFPESVMTGGRVRLQRAITTWAECTRTNTWPAYCTRAHPIFYPGWALQKLEAEGYAVASGELEAAE